MIKETLLAMKILVFSQVILTDSIVDIVAELRTVTDAPIVVTSALRTPEEQAKLMISSYHSGNNLLKTYGKKILPIILDIKASNFKKVTAYLQSHPEVSAHLCGKAIDIRSRNLTEQQIKEIMSINQVNVNYQAIREYNPPHIHVELREGC